MRKLTVLANISGLMLADHGRAHQAGAPGSTTTPLFDDNQFAVQLDSRADNTLKIDDNKSQEAHSMKQNILA